MKEKNKNFMFSIVSDTHVLSKELMVNSPDFVTFTKFDRKLLVESEDLLKESLRLVDQEKSNILIIPGDLTKDGEKLSHLKVAQTLKNWLKDSSDKKVFLIPGNHDINNSKSFDYKNNTRAENTSPKDFEDIYDFSLNSPLVLEKYRQSEIFKAYLEKINKKYNRQEENSYYAQGYFSYLARISPQEKEENGISLIFLDSSIYSIDCESSHIDKKENVAGFIEENQMIWACNKIEEARTRKDLIIFIAHHALIPNFKDQELVFAPFIIKNWNDKYKSNDKRLNEKTPIEVLADMGIKFVFTGHLHENGTTKYVSKENNEILNIQTGSPVTYPLPIRHIKITDKTDSMSGFSLETRTQLIREFVFNDLENKEIKVDNASLYTLENQLSLEDVLFNFVKTQANRPEIYNMNLKKEVLKRLSSFSALDLEEKGYINQSFPLLLKYFPKNIKGLGKFSIIIQKKGFVLKLKSYASNTITVKASSIEDVLENILSQIQNKIINKENLINYYELIAKKILKMPLYENSEKTLYDFANYIYQYKPLDENQRPDYISKFMDKLNDPSYNLIDSAIDYAQKEINAVYDFILSSISLEKDGSKSKFFNDLFDTNGLFSNLALKFASYKLDNLKDLINLFSIPVFGKSNVEGIDIVKFILHHQKLTKFRSDYSSKMFGNQSIRKYIIDLVGSMSNELVNYYQNEDFNQLDHYFNYIEFDNN